ncbi:BppU family phage baseplate upper protein [Bacillus paranthracis]
MAETGFFKPYKLTVDTKINVDSEKIVVSQNDLNSAQLLISITQDGAPLLLDGLKVKAAFEKPDKTLIYQTENVTIKDAKNGIVSIILTTQTIVAVGDVLGEIHIETENARIVTRKFRLYVERSYMSDTTLESTNEFTIIQKAIEAGKKLEGVDINGIIAAGELAKGALPKTGGTMTGNLIMEYETGKGDAQRIAFKKKGASSNKYDIASDGDTYIGAYDRSTGKRIWRYTTSDETLEVAVNSNLLKTTGGTINGDLVMATDKNIVFSSDDYLLKIRGQKGNSKIVAQVYKPDGTNTFIGEYRGDNNKLTINCDTNLLKNTGDTMTGELMLSSQASIRQMMPKTASARGFRYQDETSNAYVAGLGFYRSSDVDKGACYMGWSETPWSQANS